LKHAEQVVPGSSPANICKALVQQYPWYGAAVIWQASQEPSLSNVQKAGTFFNNPFLLHFWLSGNGSANAETLSPAQLALHEELEPADEVETATIHHAPDANIEFAIAEDVQFSPQDALEPTPTDVPAPQSSVDNPAPESETAHLPQAESVAAEIVSFQKQAPAGLEAEQLVEATGETSLAEKEVTSQMDEVEPAPFTSHLGNMLAEASRQLQQPQQAPPEKLAFEPYHTVDYFASQGIKVQNELPGGTTRFDKQLMSFTQWLRTMKRINYQTESKAEDLLVTQKANASLAEEEVITEAMAEVLEMQGRHEKAAEVYAKLILLHPEKSHYFAARISKIKEQK